jgi:hypothetical protein
VLKFYIPNLLRFSGHQHMLCDTQMLYLYKLMPERQFMPLIDWCYLSTIFTCMDYGHVDSGMSMNKETERIWKQTRTIFSSVGLSDTAAFFHNDTWHDFRKGVIEHKMCVLVFSTTFIWNISHFKKNGARYDQNCILVFMYSTHYSCQILMKVEFSGHICKKYSNIQFH